MKHNDYIRIALTIILLVVVWFHAHWSVALALTFIAVGQEAHAYMFKKIVKRI